jgi:hypothetical protein
MQLLLTPESSGYSPKFKAEVLRTDLDGGQGRYRADMIGASIMLDCTWSLNPEQYDYFMAFWRSVAKKGAIPFEIYLVIDSSQLELRTANFVPDTLTLADQRGLSYKVSATLEVRSIPVDEAADLDIVDDYNEAYG